MSDDSKPKMRPAPPVVTREHPTLPEVRIAAPPTAEQLLADIMAAAGQYGKDPYRFFAAVRLAAEHRWDLHAFYEMDIQAKKITGEPVFPLQSELLK